MALFQRLFKQNKFLPFFVINAGLVIIALILAGIIAGVMAVFKAPLLSDLFATISKFIMSDFGQVAYFTLCDNPYASNFPTMYLPLNFVLMFPFALICKSSSAVYSFENLPTGSVYDEEKYTKLLQCNVEIVSTWQFWFAIILYYLVYFTLIGLVLYKMRKWDKKADFFFAYGSVIFSGLFIIGIIRGTNVFNSLLFILLFCWLYKSDKKWQREISLVCLAVAGVCKLYPLLFGALLLKEKRILDSIKVALYFAILAVLPFGLYGNMFTNFISYLKNLSDFVGAEGRMGNKMNISVNNLVYSIFEIFKQGDSAVSSICCWIALIASFVISVWVTIKSKSKFITYTAIVIGLMIIPPVSYYYVSMFFVLPLLALIDEWGTLEKDRKIIYSVFYSVIMFLPLSALSWYFPQCIMMVAIIIWEFRHLFQSPKTKEKIL